jgi:hypothetical protein
MIFLKDRPARLERPVTGCGDPKPNSNPNHQKSGGFLTNFLIFLQPRFEDYIKNYILAVLPIKSEIV